ncbi:WYL domain-containing protein [Akkermansiaceae bacterium]|nr:WYL domain-containing protein [Akkermansiaceae bacterium]
MAKNLVTTNEKFLRLQKIIALFHDAERVKKSEMARVNECSSKTVGRDLNILKANGWPLEFDKQGYFLEQDSKGELKRSKDNQVAALVLAGCTIDRHLIEHLPSLAKDIRKHFCGLSDVKTLSYSAEDSAVFVEKCSMTSTQLSAFGAVARKIIEGLAIEFDYRAVSKKDWIKRTVYPISLKQKESVWYLIGYDLERHDLRVFTQSKVENVKFHKGLFEEPAEELIEKALNLGEFSIWDSGVKGKEIHSVKVKLSGHAADFARSHRIHHSQEVDVIDDETAILRLKTSDLIGIKLWLRKFMHLVQILEPRQLKDEFVQDLKRSLKLNE